MERSLDGKMVEWKMHGWKDAWMERCMDGKMHGWKDAWMERCMDGFLNSIKVNENEWITKKLFLKRIRKKIKYFMVM